MTVAGAVKCKIDYNALDKKGNASMCTVFEETRVEGRIEGRAEEIVETGYEFGLSDNDIPSFFCSLSKISLSESPNS